jgi:hypothetical protein
MNGYAMKKRGIRSQASIIREMISYGFSNKDIVELCPANIHHVKAILVKMRNEVKYKQLLLNPMNSDSKNIIKSLMFSSDEMDYGKQGQQKYNWKDLSFTEKQLSRDKDHKELKIYGKTEKNIKTDEDL